MLRTAALEAVPAKTLAFSTTRPPLTLFKKREAAQPGRNGTPVEYEAAVRTLAVLQTQLRLEPLLKLFSREVSHAVPHSSVHYCKDMQVSELRVGRTARHQHSFRLVVEREELGRLCFSRGKPFTREETATLELLVSSLAYPLRNALQYEDAFIASLTDPLTGVYNRNMLQHALHREVGLSRRHHTPLSLVVVDIDGLKSVNDRYGHAAGDKFIVSIARCLCRSLRETDLVARFGGDEFAILLNNTNLRGAATLAENIRRRVEKTVPHFEDETLRASVSIGIASLGRQDNDDGLFLRADRALYRAKRAGRNCIKLSNSR